MFRGFVSTWAGLIVNGIVALFLTRVLVHGLGSFYYGLWVLVSSVLDYYGLLDMGMRYSMQRFVAHYGGADQRQALNETFMTGMSMVACLALLVFFLCAALLFFLPGFFGLHGHARLLFRILLVIQSASVALGLPGRIMGAYLCGLHRFDLYNGAGIVYGLARGIVFFTVIHMGGRVVAIGVSQLLIAGFMFLLNAYFVRVADPQLSVRWSHTSWARIKELVQFSFFVFFSDIGDRLRFYTDVIVISRMLGVALATPFNVIGRLMEIFKLSLFPITGPLNTEANILEGGKKFAAARDLFLRATKACTLLAFAGTTVLVLHGRDILRFWIGEAFTSNYKLLVVLTVGYCVLLMQAPSNVFLYARSRQKLVAAFALAEGLANLGLSIYWARRYGIIGVGLGTTVPLIIMRLGIQPFYTLRIVGVGWSEFLSRTLLRPLLATATVLGLAYVTRLWSRPANVIMFAVMLLALGLLFAVVSYCVAFDWQERESVRRRGANLLARLRAERA
jgi:O-antigen/teichoic acid export membrane protein